MSKLETLQNRVYGLMRFGELSEDYWKAYNEYQNYLKEMNNRFVYRDTDEVICYPEDLVKSDVKMYEHLRKERT